MELQHRYAVETEWTGDIGGGTRGYRGYRRWNVARVEGKPDLVGSADPAFYGDADRWNPEELLVAALSECHLLSYLHVCVNHHVVVTGYTDRATGRMVTTPDGAGRFTEAVLHPMVALADESQRPLADALHEEAHRACFIANSVNFTVRVEPVPVEPLPVEPVPPAADRLAG